MSAARRESTQNSLSYIDGTHTTSSNLDIFSMHCPMHRGFVASVSGFNRGKERVQHEGNRPGSH